MDSNSRERYDISYDIQTQENGGYVTEGKVVQHGPTDRHEDDSADMASLPTSRAPSSDTTRAPAHGRVTRAVLYYRVSTNKQDEKNQVPDLRRYAEFRKWIISKEYIDHGISGGKDSRHDLDLMMSEIRKGKYDVLLVYSYDRFARSLPHLVYTMDELGKLGVGFASYQEQIDTTTPQGRLMFAIYAGLAEWMRHQIGQKTSATLRRKRDEEGMKLGRPSVPDDVRAKIVALHKQGVSVRNIAKQLTWVSASGKYGARKETTLSKSVVGKVIKELKAGTGEPERPQNLRSNVA